MSEPEKPDPLVAKKRLPFEEGRPAGLAGLGGPGFQRLILFFYVAVSAALFVFAIYLLAVQKQPFLDLHVIVPLGGALWFGLRALMLVNAARKGRG